MDSKPELRGETWPLGTNSRLLFAVNAMLYLSHSCVVLSRWRSFKIIDAILLYDTTRLRFYAAWLFMWIEICDVFPVRPVCARNQNFLQHIFSPQSRKISLKILFFPSENAQGIRGDTVAPIHSGLSTILLTIAFSWLVWLGRALAFLLLISSSRCC